MVSSKIIEMLATIEQECQFTGGLTGRYTLAENVLKAMAEIPRENFVPDNLRAYAYDNNPLPIGSGQTISQPFIVGLMTDLLEPSKDDIILEVGTGSGYQAAILAKLVKKVYSIEIVPQLARESSQRLKKLGIDNVEVVNTDGSCGLAEHAPYNGIIATAAAPHVPQVLLDQLHAPGRMVIPVGRAHLPQELVLIEKNASGDIQKENVLSVSFVPFTGRVQIDDAKKSAL